MNYEGIEFEEEDVNQAMNLAKSETLKVVLRHIAANKDDRDKTVGDRVIIWDCSRLTDVETGKRVIDPLDISILEKYYSVVLEEGLKFNTLGMVEKNLDLKVWSPIINKVYRTSSDFVKLV